jgi:arylsulfatase A-like enzyme
MRLAGPPRARGPLDAAVLAGGLLAACLLAACGPHRASPAGGPVVLITLDALRADQVGGLGGGPGLTPNLDALIRQADWAGRAVAASSWAVPSMASLLTGLTPWQHHAILEGNARLADDLITLPKALKALGYRTTAFTTGRWFTSEQGYDRGFDAFDVMGRNRDAAEHLAALGGGRELVWIHMAEPDAPWVRRDWLLPRLGAAAANLPALPALPAVIEPQQLETWADPSRPRPAGLRRQLWAMYRLNVAWADEKIGRLVEALRESGQWDRALVVVTSEFGEEIDEHGVAGHGGDLERETIEVPLIVKLPSWYRHRLAPPRRERVGLVRLWATLVEAAGGQPPPAMAPSLFQGVPAPVLSELYFGNGSNLFSLVDGDDQLLWESHFAAPEPHYDSARFAAAAGAAGAESRGPQSAEAITGRLFDAFAATPPLAGRDAPRLRLNRWPERGGVVPAAAVRPAVLGALTRRLAAQWRSFLPAELSPEAEDRQWLDQLPPPPPVPPLPSDTAERDS